MHGIVSGVIPGTSHLGRDSKGEACTAGHATTRSKCRVAMIITMIAWSQE